MNLTQYLSDRENMTHDQSYAHLQQAARTLPASPLRRTIRRYLLDEETMTHEMDWHLLQQAAA